MNNPCGECGASAVTFSPPGAYGSVNGHGVFTHGVEIGVSRHEAHDLQTASIEDAGRETGRVYAANTCGAALGAAAAGFLIVPYVGVMFALRLAAVLNLIISAVAAVYDRRRSLASDIAGGHRPPLQFNSYRRSWPGMPPEARYPRRRAERL